MLFFLIKICSAQAWKDGLFIKCFYLPNEALSDGLLSVPM